MSLSFWCKVYHALVLLCCKFERDRWSQRGGSRQKLLEASGRVGAILTTVASRGCPQCICFMYVSNCSYCLPNTKSIRISIYDKYINYWWHNTQFSCCHKVITTCLWGMRDVFCEFRLCSICYICHYHTVFDITLYTTGPQWQKECA